jgi:two-component system, OmpR family, heavy metal sensor histidine kinase CusS
MRWHRRSISAQLTLGLGLVALLVLSTAGVLLHRALAAKLYSADQVQLRGKVAAVLHFVDAAARSADHRKLVHDLDDLKIGHQGLGIWIALPSGQRLYGDGSLAVVDSKTALVGVRRLPADLATTVLPATSPWPGAVLSVAQQSQGRDELLSAQLATLFAVSALGVAGSVALSWLVVRHCLGPLRRLSDEAGEISPRVPGKRLTVPDADEELGVLVRSVNEVLGRLEAAYAHLQAFSANVAHELRTPLASLMTGTQVALTRGGTQEALRGALESNLEELSLLSSLVNDMLFLSRADSGDRAEGLERVHLGQVADTVVSYCEAMLHDARVRAIRVGDAAVLCNRALVYRALVNLLTNAIHHTPSEGTVQLRMETVGSRAVVAVWNPGPPIDDGVRSQMFNRFYGTDAARLRGGRGQGLGLAIVAAIARMHGGDVFVARERSMNGVGFELPGGDAAGPSASGAAEVALI